jgi:hypothetical protein
MMTRLSNPFFTVHRQLPNRSQAAQLGSVGPIGGMEQSRAVQDQKKSKCRSKDKAIKFARILI